jgi:hypothetical protein
MRLGLAGKAKLVRVERRGAERSDSVIHIRLQSVAAALGACVFVVLLFVGSGPPERPKPTEGPTSGKSPSVPVGRPTVTSPEGLRALSASLGQPVYWLGARPGTKLELTRTTTGRIFVRYLPQSSQIGDPNLAYPIVATYRYPGAFDAVLKASRGTGSVVRRLKSGGLAVQGGGVELVRATPRPLPSAPVFLAYQGSDYLIEVYDRSAERALASVTSRRVRPVR